MDRIHQPEHHRSERYEGPSRKAVPAERPRRRVREWRHLGDLCQPDLHPTSSDNEIVLFAAEDLGGAVASICTSFNSDGLHRVKIAFRPVKHRKVRAYTLSLLVSTPLSALVGSAGLAGCVRKFGGASISSVDAEPNGSVGGRTQDSLEDHTHLGLCDAEERTTPDNQVRHLLEQHWDIDPSVLSCTDDEGHLVILTPRQTAGSAPGTSGRDAVAGKTSTSDEVTQESGTEMANKEEGAQSVRSKPYMMWQLGYLGGSP